MTADGVIRFMSFFTSRPFTVTVFLLGTFLWCATFFYVIPKASDGWFGPTVSITFGVFGVVPAVASAVAVIVRLIRGQPIVAEASGVCPCCGQPLPSAPLGTPAAQ